MSYYRDGVVDEQFAVACGVLAEALGARVSEEQIRIHANLLGDVPWEKMRVAFRAAASELERGFYPTPGQLRRFVEPNVDDAAVLAWASLERAAETVGAWASLEVSDPLAAEALRVAFGSWPQFCAFEDGPARSIKRQEFLAAYRDSARRPHPDHPVVLIGLCPPHPEAVGVTWQGRIGSGGVSTVERTRQELPASSRREIQGEHT